MVFKDFWFVCFTIESKGKTKAEKSLSDAKTS